MNNLELLRIETVAIWSPDQFGAVDPAPELVILQAVDGQAAITSPALDEHIADQLRGLVEASELPADPAEEPAALAGCVAVLSSRGAVEVASGPSFVVEDSPAQVESGNIHRSDQSWPTSLRETRPQSVWAPDDWNDLLDGRYGPWAVIINDAEVVAVCHTARSVPSAVEAGVWTHPDHRRQGNAAAVTAAWGGIVAGQDRHAFYSTSAENIASQQVARRLGLHPIGWMWKLRLHDR